MALLNIFIFLKAQTWGSPRQNSGISRLPLFIQLKMHMSQVDQRVCNGNVSVGFLQYNKHLFVHIGHANHSYSDPLLESVDIRQIYDKFPEKKGGLKELFGKGPQNAFFLVKFWVSKTLLWFQWFLSEWSRAVHWLWIHTDWSAASPSHHRLNNPGPSSCWHIHVVTQVAFAVPAKERHVAPWASEFTCEDDKELCTWLESQWQS